MQLEPCLLKFWHCQKWFLYIITLTTHCIAHKNQCEIINAKNVELINLQIIIDPFLIQNLFYLLLNAYFHGSSFMILEIWIKTIKTQLW